MKKIIIGIASAAVIGISSYGIYNLYLSNDTVEAATENVVTKKIVNTYEDEGPDAGADNSLSTAIYNTAMVANQLDDDTDVIETYEKGAIEWADKVNASEEIKSELKKALEYTQSGRASEASEVLSTLNEKYNKGNPHFKN